VQLLAEFWPICVAIVLSVHSCSVLQFKLICVDSSPVMEVLRSHFAGGDAIMEVARAFTHRGPRTRGLEGAELLVAQEASALHAHFQQAVTTFGVFPRSQLLLI
jgi:hypothetical protein